MWPLANYFVTQFLHVCSEDDACLSVLTMCFQNTSFGPGCLLTLSDLQISRGTHCDFYFRFDEGTVKTVKIQEKSSICLHILLLEFLFITKDILKKYYQENMLLTCFIMDLLFHMKLFKIIVQGVFLTFFLYEV